MSHCICQSDNQTKKIIKLISNKDDFSNIIISLMKTKYIFTLLKYISPNAVFINDYFDKGYYLLVNDGETYLVDNTEKKILFTWELLDYEVDTPQESDLVLSEKPSKSLSIQKLNIEEFNLNQMCPNPAILIIAKRGSGKSFIVANILKHLGMEYNTTIIAPTDKINRDYPKKFPNANIHYNLTEELLTSTLKRQVGLMEKNKIIKNLDPNGVLVMDDCLAQKKTWVNSPSITEVMMNGRHYRLSYVLTIQDPMGLPPNIRLNFDYVFLLKESSAILKKKLFLNYAAMFPSLDVFEKTFSAVTEDYRAMVIDNRKQCNNISDQIYWFKAKHIPNVADDSDSDSDSDSEISL